MRPPLRSPSWVPLRIVTECDAARNSSSTPGRSMRRVRSIDSHAGTSLIGSSGSGFHNGNLTYWGAHHVNCPVGYLGEIFRYQHGIDEAQAVQVLCNLDPFWEGSPVERF